MSLVSSISQERQHSGFLISKSVFSVVTLYSCVVIYSVVKEMCSFLLRTIKTIFIVEMEPVMRLMVFPCKLNSFQILFYCDSYRMLTLCDLHSLDVGSLCSCFFCPL